MPQITYIHSDGATDVIEVEPGTSIMRGAITNGVAGIVGECGGQAMCATCHVYVAEEFLGLLPEMSEDEDEMLDVTASPRDDVHSRLGCQVKVGSAIDHITVTIPESQVHQ